MFAPNKKKSPFGETAPAFGKPKGNDLDAPSPVDRAAKTPPKPQAQPQPEAAEPPAQEATEDYGAKIMADVEAAGQRLGLDASASRSFAADVLASLSACLRGGEMEAQPAAGVEEFPV